MTKTGWAAIIPRALVYTVRKMPELVFSLTRVFPY